MPKRPSFQYYPADWLSHMALQSCSMGARGLWHEMILLMHGGSPYGHLKVGGKVGGKVILPPNLARLVGETLEDVQGWLDELEGAEVFARRSDGTIYSRRMVRDEDLRQRRAAGGSKGGNPTLKDKVKVRGKVTPKVETKVNQNPTLPPTPSSSSSSPSSSSKNPPTGEEAAAPPRARSPLEKQFDLRPGEAAALQALQQQPDRINPEAHKAAATDKKKLRNEWVHHLARILALPPVDGRPEDWPDLWLAFRAKARKKSGTLARDDWDPQVAAFRQLWALRDRGDEGCEETARKVQHFGLRTAEAKGWRTLQATWIYGEIDKRREDREKMHASGKRFRR